ncbi:unnamed protein product [Arctogadus glacialis]
MEPGPVLNADTQDLLLQVQTLDIFLRVHTQDPLLRDHTQDPLLRDHTQDPLLRDHTQDPLLRDHTQDPLLRDHTQDPLLRDHTQDPLLRDHTQEPLLWDHTQEPVIRDHTQKPPVPGYHPGTPAAPASRELPFGRESEGERERAAGGGRMTGSPENIPLGECPLSQSRDQLTPPSRTESTVFSLSRSESLWTTEASGPGIYQVYWFAIHLMTTGGSFLACGVIISGLYFTGYLDKVTRILGPGLLSIGLMVLVVGVVLIPITKKNRKQPALKRPLSYYRPPQFNV